MRYAIPVKTGAVVVGAMILASIVVRATDVLLPTNTQVGQVAGVQKEKLCEEGMVHVSDGDSSFCIDAYEVSPSEACLNSSPTRIDETAFNLRAPDCIPESKSGHEPWRHVTLSQAIEACVKAGKRLPTAKEWYRAAIGTPDDVSGTCALDDSGAQPTGARSGCVSQAGAYDMVGNVWEWVDEEVLDGALAAGRDLPGSGYVHGVDTAGVALVLGAASTPVYGGDRIWVEEEGLMGMMRGGYYGSVSDGGLYAIYAASPPTFSGTAVGFRCAKDF